MDTIYKAIKVSEHVYWVGAIDWELSDFHGYATPRGSTYNAYLILADKITLIDTVKDKFQDELLGRISSVIDPTKIDYIISNHSEMDHSGCLTEIMELVKPEKVFASAKGLIALDKHFGLGDKVEKIGKSDILDLGNMKLSFLETPMVHWPDSMFTYLDADKVLFSNDAFGMHLASSERFVDELDFGIIKEEAAKYYANILMPTSKMVLKVLKAFPQLGEIDIIAPDHGPVWREKLDSVLNWYQDWAVGNNNQKAVVIYDTMWNSTAKMAKVVAEGLISEGISVKLMSLQKYDRSEVIKEILDASALLVGSPTLNAGIFPTVADHLTYIEGMKPILTCGAVFGSYGWSDKSTSILEEWMQKMKIDLVTPKVSSNYIPDEDVLQKAYEMGKSVAAKIKEAK